MEKTKGKNVIIVGGGIGLAPLKPIIYYLLQNRDNFAKLYLLYGSKTEKEILFKNELEKWFRTDGISVLISVDKIQEEDTSKDSLINCQGMVTILFDKITIPLAETITFACGPEVMMRCVANYLMLEGQDPQDVFISLERNMRCGIAQCGHCQIGSRYVCKDGPIFSYAEITRYADTLL
ncbi:MAG: hypothetical protein V1872_02660 [bacterium]